MSPMRSPRRASNCSPSASRPAAVGQGLLRRLGGEHRDLSRNWGHGRRGSYTFASRSALSRVLGSEHVQVHAGADLEPGELGEPRHDLDAPAEARRVAGRRAHPHVQRWQRAERGAQPVQHLVEQPPAEWPVVGETCHRGARRELDVERHACGERGDRHGLVVDRHDALAAAHLLLDEVLEQVAALGAVRVRGEALALARHRGGHEGAARRAARACAAARRRPPCPRSRSRGRRRRRRARASARARPTSPCPPDRARARPARSPGRAR